MAAPLRLEDLVDVIERKNPGGAPLDLLADSVLVSGQLSELADELVGYFVEVARESGASWAEVGAALGVSKQAAQKRFVGPAKPRWRRGLFTRFAEDAREVVIRAQEHARASGSEQVGTEHILLGIVQDEGSVATQAIVASGVALSAVSGAVGRQSDSPTTVKGHIPFSTDAKKVLELSLREALRLGDDHIGTEHILLALLRDRESAGGAILHRAGVSRKAVDDWINRSTEVG